ncbi:MAG: hypothetical protein ABFD92_05710 [Planctomycetaceae bacterium]|nr:hypothetical protein [Planctomycetaceae bacterium]
MWLVIRNTVCAAIALAAACFVGGGCNSSPDYAAIPAAHVPLIIKDQNGKPLNDCVLLQVYLRSEWHVSGGFPAGASGAPANIIDHATCSVISSGQLLHQEEVRQKHGKYAGMLQSWTVSWLNDLRVYRNGYLPEGISDYAVNRAAERNEPLTVVLVPEKPGAYDSDFNAVYAAQHLLRVSLHHLNVSDPAVRRLIELLDEKLERVVLAPPPSIGYGPLEKQDQHESRVRWEEILQKAKTAQAGLRAILAKGSNAASCTK